MPSAEIIKSQLISFDTLNSNQIQVVTPLGITLLEIQGDLQMPKEPPTEDIGQKFNKDKGYDILRFGLLSLNIEEQKAILFIGEKQKLLGALIKLETPLGVLKFNKNLQTVELQDIIRYKVIFKDRPLPVI